MKIVAKLREAGGEAGSTLHGILCSLSCPGLHPGIVLLQRLLLA